MGVVPVRLCVCLCVHMCKCVQVWMYAQMGWACMWIQTCTHCAGVHRRACSHVCPCVRLCMPVHTYRWACTCVQAPVAVPVCGYTGVWMSRCEGVSVSCSCAHMWTTVRLYLCVPMCAAIQLCGCTCVHRYTRVCGCTHVQIYVHHCTCVCM